MTKTSTLWNLQTSTLESVASVSNPSGHNKDYIMWNHVLIFYFFQGKNPRFYG